MRLVGGTHSLPVVVLHDGTSFALAGPRCVRIHRGETACAPVLMADPAPPVPTGIQGTDRHVRIGRMAQGAGRKKECNIGDWGRNSTWRAKANGGHERHCLTITGVSAVSKRTVVRLEQIDDGGGSPDQPHQWKANRGEDEWKGERQENSQRHIGEQGQGPVSPRQLWPGDVDD